MLERENAMTDTALTIGANQNKSTMELDSQNKTVDDQQNNESQMANPKLTDDVEHPIKSTRKSSRQQRVGRLSIKRTPDQFIKQMKHSKRLSFKV